MRTAAVRHASVSWGTTEASATPARSLVSMPSEAKSGASFTRSSSEVWCLLVATRHRWRRSPSRYTPNTVWVFPTSMASNMFLTVSYNLVPTAYS